LSRPRALLPALGLGALVLASPALPGVAGQIALYPALGVFPGMALATLLAGRERHAPRWALGLALAPLVSTTLAVPLVMGGWPLSDAARAVALVGFVTWLLGTLRPRLPGHAFAGDPAPDLRWMLALSLGLALVTSIPWIVNPLIRVRSDAWVHAGIVWDIIHHGLPPEDPRFAGLLLNYVWFFNLFVALLTDLGARDPFVFMMIFNAVNLGVCATLAYRIALTLWRDRGAAAGGALLLVLGMNAGAWLLWPLRFVRAAIGSDRGWDEVARLAQEHHLGTTHIVFDVHAPLAYTAVFLDKFMVGTALSFAWILMLLVLWAMVLWLRDGLGRALFWMGIASAGMLLFHGVVGLSVLPVLLGALSLAWLLSFRLPWPTRRGRLVALALVAAGGGALALPYTWLISAGWTAERSGIEHQYLRPHLAMVWTLLTSCGLALWITRRALMRLWRERRVEGAVLLLFLAGMTVFALVIHLPLDNESKFSFQVFFPLALIGGPAFLPWAQSVVRRLGRPVGGLALALLFVAAPVGMVVSFAVDASGSRAPALNPEPGEEALYAWIRAHTEPNAVFTDRAGRDLIMVKGQRRLWVGTTDDPAKAAFPEPELNERRSVEGDLYGTARSLDRDAESLARLARPVYVLFRASDFPSPTSWSALESRPDLFVRVYDHDGFRVYRLRG
jgi:hypothetical protein